MPAGRENRQGEGSRQPRGRTHTSRARALVFPHGERDPRRGDRSMTIISSMIDLRKRNSDIVKILTDRKCITTQTIPSAAALSG